MGFDKFESDRLRGAFDGVFAIAATILVLELEVPVVEGTLERAELREIGLNIAQWLVSFIVTFVFWHEFHWIFRSAREFDIRLVVIVALEMACISLVPFASKVLNASDAHLIGSLFYITVMGSNVLLLTLANSIIIGAPHLHSTENADVHLRARRNLQMGIFTGVITASIVVTVMHDPWLGVLFWGLAPVLIALRTRSIQ